MKKNLGLLIASFLLIALSPLNAEEQMSEGVQRVLCNNLYDTLSADGIKSLEAAYKQYSKDRNAATFAKAILPVWKAENPTKVDPIEAEYAMSVLNTLPQDQKTQYTSAFGPKGFDFVARKIISDHPKGSPPPPAIVPGAEPPFPGEKEIGNPNKLLVFKMESTKGLVSVEKSTGDVLFPYAPFSKTAALAAQSMDSVKGQERQALVNGKPSFTRVGPWEGIGNTRRGRAALVRCFYNSNGIIVGPQIYYSNETSEEIPVAWIVHGGLSLEDKVDGIALSEVTKNPLVILAYSRDKSGEIERVDYVDGRFTSKIKVSASGELVSKETRTTVDCGGPAIKEEKISADGADRETTISSVADNHLIHTSVYASNTLITLGTNNRSYTIPLPDDRNALRDKTLTQCIEWTDDADHIKGFKSLGYKNKDAKYEGPYILYGETTIEVGPMKADKRDGKWTIMSFSSANKRQNEEVYTLTGSYEDGVKVGLWAKNDHINNPTYEDMSKPK